MTTLSVARQFSRFPGGRFKRISDNSGEEFRDDVLIPALRREAKIIVDLDGVVGYGSSFLEEVFGGLVRAMKWMTREEVNRHLLLQTTQESWRQEADQYIDDAILRLRAATH